jgi:hypothetical protein
MTKRRRRLLGFLVYSLSYGAVVVVLDRLLMLLLSLVARLFGPFHDRRLFVSFVPRPDT